MVKSIRKIIVNVSAITLVTHMLFLIVGFFVGSKFIDENKRPSIDQQVLISAVEEVDIGPKYPIHIVKEGEFLSKIAKQYSLTPYTVASVNKIPKLNQLEVGQKLIMRPLEKNEVQYLVNLITARDIVDDEIRENLIDVIYDDSKKFNIDPMIVLGIFGAETTWNPYLTAMYVTIPDKTNLPPRFTNLQNKVVIPYNCSNPRPYKPDMGGMQVSYNDAKGTLNLCCLMFNSLIAWVILKMGSKCNLHMLYGERFKVPLASL